MVAGCVGCGPHVLWSKRGAAIKCTQAQPGHISLWEGCRNFGILLLKVERVTFSRRNLTTHKNDTKYLNHIEKADSLSFPTV